MLKPIFFTPQSVGDFDELGPFLAVGPLVLIGFKRTSNSIVICVIGLGFGVWYDAGDDE